MFTSFTCQSASVQSVFVTHCSFATVLVIHWAIPPLYLTEVQVHFATLFLGVGLPYKHDRGSRHLA